MALKFDETTTKWDSIAFAWDFAVDLSVGTVFVDGTCVLEMVMRGDRLFPSQKRES